MRIVFDEFRRIYAAYFAFDRDAGGLLAAAVAYFVGLSLFPLFSVLIAITGQILAYTAPGQNAEHQVMRTVEQHVSPVVASQVAEMLALVREDAGTSGPISFLTLLITAIACFYQFEQAFDRIWNVPPPETRGILASLKSILVDRLIAFVMLTVIGGIVILAFLSATILTTVQAKTEDLLPASGFVWNLAQFGISLSINIAAFTVLYRWLPKVDVPWLAAFRGAILVALAWEVGRSLLSAFLVGTRYSSAYGIVGTFIGILIWCYYACIIVFIAAEYVQSLVNPRPPEAATEA